MSDPSTTPPLPQPASTSRRSAAGWTVGLLAVVLVLVVTSVRRPPVLDLPQQLEQATLFSRWLAGTDDSLRVDLSGSNKIGTAIAIATGIAVPASWAPRAVLVVMVLLWSFAIFWIVVARRRDIWSGAMACTCLLSSPFYSGFLNFLAGAIAFAFWAWELSRDPARRSIASLAGFTTLGTAWLYFSHGLWLVFGGAVVVTYLLCFRFSWREFLARALGTLPTAVLALSGSESLSQGGWQSNVDMRLAPWERLANWNEISTLFLGALHGPWEKLFLGLVLIWLLTGLLSRPDAESESPRFDRFLGLGAALALAWAILLPDKVDRTVLFAWRWGPIAVALALLAFPPPFLNARRRGLFAAAAIGLLVLPTWRAWKGFESEEMAGFEQALAAIPPGSTVAGLDYRRRSPRFKNAPCFQMFAYASVERDARINFSFSEVASSIVRRAPDAPVPPWTKELDISPQYFSLGDFRHFDYLLVTASAETVETLARRLDFVRQVAGEGPWHLVGVDRERAARVCAQWQHRAESADVARAPESGR